MESGLLFYKGYGKLRPMTGKKYGHYCTIIQNYKFLVLKTNICYKVITLGSTFIRTRHIVNIGNIK